MRIFLRILLGLLLSIVAIAVFMHLRAGSERTAEAAYHKALSRTIRLETTKFQNDSLLADECTCKGADQSPELYWKHDIPGVKSFALIMTDPDVPSPAFPLFNLTHWLVYDIPPSYFNLPQGLLNEQAVKHDAQFGKNSMGDLKYVGPCPPVGRHVYEFKIYALDKRLTPAKLLERRQLLDAMQGHILGYGELRAFYAAE